MTGSQLEDIWLGPYSSKPKAPPVHSLGIDDELMGSK